MCLCVCVFVYVFAVSECICLCTCVYVFGNAAAVTTLVLSLCLLSDYIGNDNCLAAATFAVATGTLPTLSYPKPTPPRQPFRPVSIGTGPPAQARAARPSAKHNTAVCRPSPGPRPGPRPAGQRGLSARADGEKV